MNIEEMCQGLHRLCMCLRKPTVCVDGKPYCWQHDPARKRRIASEKWRKRKEEIAKLEASFDADIERKKLLTASGVGKVTNEDLQTIIDAGGIKSLIEFWWERQG